jgi:hypothetical protein
MSPLERPLELSAALAELAVERALTRGAGIG